MSTWKQQQEQRIREAIRRVARDEPRLIGIGGDRGRRRAVYSPDLQIEFKSISAAARFVGLSRSSGHQNILRAVRMGSRAGGVRWVSLRE